MWIQCVIQTGAIHIEYIYIETGRKKNEKENKWEWDYDGDDKIRKEQ